MAQTPHFGPVVSPYGIWGRVGWQAPQGAAAARAMGGDAARGEALAPWASEARGRGVGGGGGGVQETFCSVLGQGAKRRQNVSGATNPKFWNAVDRSPLATLEVFSPF